MATWRDISVQQAQAARQLRGAEVVRPSISRAYYAAYSAATHALHRQGIRRFGKHGNPDHGDVPALVLHTMRNADRSSRQALAGCLHRLRASREDADYRPQVSVGAHARFRAIWDMEYALNLLGKFS